MYVIKDLSGKYCAFPPSSDGKRRLRLVDTIDEAKLFLDESSLRKVVDQLARKLPSDGLVTVDDLTVVEIALAEMNAEPASSFMIECL